MPDHTVATKEQWLEARKELLQKEKAHSRAQDELAKARRSLPWVKIHADYTFDTDSGRKTFAELFGGKSQLLVYHFMFDPEWDEGCKSCSYLTDHYQFATEHLAARDVTLVAVSRAPLAKLQAYKKRMGWRHEWVSSHGSDFNYDFQVSWRQGERESGKAVYNFREGGFPSSEGHGASVFIKTPEGIFHTYSTYGRGLDILIGTYNLLDLVPKGRGEEGLSYTMEWLERRDEY